MLEIKVSCTYWDTTSLLVVTRFSRFPLPSSPFLFLLLFSDPEIPCEFCGVGFPSSRINAHQVECHDGPTILVPPSHVFFFSLTQPTCTKNPDFRSLMQQQALGTQSTPGFVASPEDVAMGPCEFCGDQLPLTNLFRHEVRAISDSLIPRLSPLSWNGTSSY